MEREQTLSGKWRAKICRMVLCCFVMSISASAAITHVGDVGTAYNNAAGTTLQIPVGAAGVAAGNTIIVGFASRGAATYNQPTVTDSRGNSYSMATVAVTYQHGRSYIYYANVESALANGDNITITTSSVQSRVAVASVFSGVASYSPLDQALGYPPLSPQTTAQGNNASVGPTGTTSQAEELVIGVIGTEDAPTADAGIGTWLNDFVTGPTVKTSSAASYKWRVSLGYKIVTATNQFTAAKTYVNNPYWAASIATFGSQNILSPSLYNIVLGRPTANTVTVNSILQLAGDVKFEYGTSPGSYSTQTGSTAATAGEPFEVVISGLYPNTKYYYRLLCKPTGETAWLPGQEYSFYTKRAAGATFTFTIISDSHLGQTFSGNDPDRYEQTTLNVAADEPDFHIDLGDAFVVSSDLGVGTNETGNQSQVDAVYQGQRPYFGNYSHSVPVFLAIGNHENEEGWNIDDTPFSRALASIKARKEYFPNPVPGSFYSGNNDLLPAIGGDQLREDYYAWTWGDALFIVLDPFQYTMTKTYGDVTGSGEDTRAQEPEETVVEDQWIWTLGQEQYDWFKETLESSTASFKFVFAHHVVGGQLNVSGGAGTPEYVRGGGLAVPYFEWGGYNGVSNPEYPDDWGFDDERSGWGDDPIHQLMIDNNVSAFFHGHDHQFVHEERDGIVYQLVPSASMTGTGFNLYTSSPWVVSGGNLPNAGHIRVTVAPNQATVQYVRSAISGDTGVTNGQISHEYTIDAQPIAVELASFRARLADKNAIVVEWQTASEVKTAGFFVQRSENSERGFARIHDQIIKARGSSTVGADYQFIDAGHDGQECFYRLEEVTLDGASSFSEPIALSFVSSSDDQAQLPLSFALSQNYPNPFNPTTQIDYSIPSAGLVTLKIYDLNGRQVKQLVQGFRKEGHYTVEWDGTSDDGRQVMSGTYIYRLQAGERTAVGKMAFLK